MEFWKIIVLSKSVICRFHVNLPGCTDSTILFVVTTKNAIYFQFVVELWYSLYSSWAIKAPPLVGVDMHDMIVPPTINQRDSMYSILPK